MAFTPPCSWVAPRTWTRDGSDFFISNDPKFLSVDDVQAAFRREFMYWTKKDLPDEIMAQILYGSMSFGVYKRNQLSGSQATGGSATKATEQIGLARMATDGVTFGYLSDVYVLPEYQGKGLGKWLINCVVEIFSPKTMPYLRRTMLLTGDKHVEEMYGKAFNMKVVGHEKRPDLGKDLVFMCGRPNAPPESD